jgi:hypothetical protein
MGPYLSEEQVKKAVHLWFNQHRSGWKLVSFTEGRRHGADLVFKRHPRKYVIEAKGDGVRGVRESEFYRALGQLVTRIDQKETMLCAVAFPESYQPMLKRIKPAAWKLLKLNAFLVDKNGVARKVTSRDVHPRRTLT